MSEWVNFAEIREKVSLEEVILGYCQIEGLKRDHNKLVGPCPIHHGDSPRAFHADLDKNVWHCFSQCKRGGNQLDFVALKEGIPIREAALKLHAFFLARASPTGNSAHAPPPSAPDRETEEDGEANPPLNVKLDLRPDHPHLIQDRGLELETTKLFDVGYCHRGIMRGCIAIPIHDEAGDLVAYAGRRLKPQDIREYGKYKLPKGFRKELVLYNLHRAGEHASKAGLILVEGFFTVMKLHQAGFPNTVAAMGCELSDAQARLLADARTVIILFDGNQAGYSGAIAARDKLTARGTTARLARLPEGLEPEDLSTDALRWLVNGLTTLDLAEVAFNFRPQEKGVKP